MSEMCRAQCVRKWHVVRVTLFDVLHLEVSIKSDTCLVGTQCRIYRLILENL